MDIVVYRSCLQRPKDVVFERLSERVWLWWWWRKEEKDEEECREKLKDERLRERIEVKK